MTNAADPALDLVGVSLRLEGRLVLDALTLRADERRIGIVGRNGAGKSTLARLIAGLEEPQEGALSVFGVNVARDRARALSTVGILFQNPDHQIIFPTVDEEITFGLRQMGMTKNEAHARTTDMLEAFGKSHWAGASVATLSQGQKQLLCLMAVLAMAPRLIVLDEPLSGLDIPTRLQLTRYLDAAPATLVHISHDPATLAGYERVIWLSEGRLRADGAATKVLAAFTREMQDLGGRDDISDLAG
ncbi:energy-coupling factor ABC transporter ATP-binding protein [Roseovarius sp. LXJ103]|uniref:energy-coupling factor ABC transporter ATP-binding protein n=1 Tax=Roseovarius carneus TaxID=2853164 RepID=UPI000D6128D6|nr:ABC transporter ATP-binding protein [Roseovarius carneus]MBZ8117439.1 energy-coupling factor ABC transporter ATP-binding protein [Roseovarius carneus]PWE36755.1 cobalt ABC transporter [Pelagicola sp. LXJ1103]